MGRAINNENDIDTLKMEVKELQELKRDVRELQGVVAELSEALMSTKQVHHVDMDEEFMPPAGKRKRTTKRKTAKVD